MELDNSSNQNDSLIIPKIIHYCWFGGNPLPELAQKCIKSWEKYCSNYEIKRWDESNFDFNCCEYVREAYEEKMWAFVSDYARFKILYENGGVYLDTDVELIKPIDDIVEKGPFLGLEESDETNIALATGLGFAANAGFDLLKEVLDDYHQSHFEKDKDGTYQTVVARVTKIVLKHGNIYPDRITEVAGITIYPPEFFCPMSYYMNKINVTENTRSIHHYMASWTAPEVREIFKIKKYLSNKSGIRKVMGDAMIYILKIIYKLKTTGLKGIVGYIRNKLRLTKFDGNNT